MKLALSFAFLAALVNGECAPEVSVNIGEKMKKIVFNGYEPMVSRFQNTGMGNKVLLKGFSVTPKVTETETTIEIAQGEPCGDVSPPSAPPPTGGTDPSSSATRALAFGLPMLFGHKLGLPVAATAFAVGLTAFGPSAYAQTAECSTVPIEVEIYVEATVEDIVNKMYKAGKYNECPAETQYWEHPEGAFGGYKGCVAERGLYPCASDATDISREGGAFYDSSPVVWDPENDVCVETGKTIEDQLFIIRGGNPMDKHEIVARTGSSPVIVLPFTRMPYPSYRRGVDVSTDPQSEDVGVRVTIKKMLEYIDAWTAEELQDYDITLTEGAEQSMVYIFAGKALEIARTTCNRDIYVMVESPSYGYSNSHSADVVNGFASSFYNGPECPCFNTTTCNDPTVTLSTVGWFPGTPYPERMGGDGMMYSSVSPSDSSPWFESLVFPENPSGVFKQTRNPNVNRRVCDGVYLWPMYMGGKDWTIPKEILPDCSAWGFSISKIYSAAARAGWMMYKELPETNHDSMVDVIGTTYRLYHGSMSQWTWQGMTQLLDNFMSKPYTDPTSWIGAYKELLEEKYDYMIEGFMDCPVMQLSNPYSGAYAWFVMQPAYLGIQEGASSPTFFRNVLGTSAFGYTWGFRGADPADYYGEGYTVNDFTRVNMYRDINIYKELARRAKIVCSDPDASVGGGLLSVNQWQAAATASRRRRLHQGEYESIDEHKRHLKEVVPDLTEAQLNDFTSSEALRREEDAAIETCAPEYSTSCVFGVLGPDKDGLF